MTGILAIWNDCAEDGEDHYERWYSRQHLFERVGIAGFRFGRRYEALDADRRFFTFYEVDGTEILTSPAYLECLENPTAWTRQAMASFRGMIRTVCDLAFSTGELTGAHAVTLRFAQPLGHITSATEFVMELAKADGVGRVQLWTAAADQTPSETQEMKGRGGPDEMIFGAVFAECIRRADADRIAVMLTREAPRRIGAAGAGHVGTYAFLCAHERTTR